MPSKNYYNPADYGEKEVELVRKFTMQYDDSLMYFKSVIKPRLDRSYKLYIADNRDRAKEIKSWQANIFIPYIQAVVETLKPRILDARPDFLVDGRNQDDQARSSTIKKLHDFTWEISNADTVLEDVVSSSLTYGMGYMQPYWKKDVRENKYLKTKDINSDKYVWVKKKETYYDAPAVDWVDNYSLMYDWHNTDGVNKQYWFKRLVLSGETIKRRYPMADKAKLDLALTNNKGDLTDYASIRNEVKLVHDKITKGADYGLSGSGLMSNRYANSNDPDVRLHEVIEGYWPYLDMYGVRVNEVMVFKKGSMPNPYNFKDAPFIGIPYLRLPGEYEGYGLPMILENPQVMLNMIKNQRLDATTLSIHKMWIVNPLANVNKQELVTRPFGIIYSVDPNGVREVQFSDIKGSAYKEEDMLKNDMRYASGVDDASMGVGGGASSATETRHLRESTLERVRLYVNHLGDGLAKLMEYWTSMYGQFFTKPIILRIVGEDGQIEFPVVQKDDLKGKYDFKATVIPSIAGQKEVEKKQDMDLFQLLINLPFTDPLKLTTKVLKNWNWDINSIKKEEQPPQPGMPGAEGAPAGMEGAPAGAEGMMPPGAEGMPPEMMAAMAGGAPARGEMPNISSKMIPPNIAAETLALLSGGAGGPSGFQEAAMPMDLMGGANPPTARGIPTQTTNPRGFNRGGRVNTNIPQKPGNGAAAQLSNRANNIQR